jgi:3-oxoadipate enol-lactonase/4-carboxymuconolactone decarboxylase
MQEVWRSNSAPGSSLRAAKARIFTFEPVWNNGLRSNRHQAHHAPLYILRPQVIPLDQCIHTMRQRIFVAPDLTLQTSVSGDGPNLVLIHGMGGNLSFWAGQARTFSRRFRVIRYDVRGHGASSPSVRQDLETHARDLATLLDALTVETTHVVGLSMGGLIAQAFAASFPHRIDRLALVGTVAAFPAKGKEALRNLATLADAEGMASVAARFVPQLFGQPPLESRRRALIAAMAAQDAASFSAAARALADADLTPSLSNITAPTLLCYGAHDRQTPSFLGERIAAALADARMEIFPNAGHLPSFESPLEFDRALLRFFTSEGGASAPHST